MPTSFLEIVEMPDGRIVLRRADEEEALVTLEFSGDAKDFLQGQHVEVAKAMFNVGVQMAGRLAEGEMGTTKVPASCTERCRLTALAVRLLVQFNPDEYSGSVLGPVGRRGTVACAPPGSAVPAN